MWSLYGAFTSDWITDGTYTLSQPLNSVEQITVSVPYGDTARTNESYFVFHVPEGTVVTTPSWSYNMDLYKGKTIADVKAAGFPLLFFHAAFSLWQYTTTLAFPPGVQV